jgi:hypothetical protein
MQDAATRETTPNPERIIWAIGAMIACSPSAETPRRDEGWADSRNV